MQKIFRLLMVAAAIVLGGSYFVHWSRTRALNSGEVRVRQQSDDKARPDTATEFLKQHDSAGQPAQPQEVASNSTEASATHPSRSGYRGSPQSGVASLPATETISGQPPNGIVAAGSGKFQLYRQGDLTFRLDTETGQACVLFATDTEWRKPVVYQHGCGNHSPTTAPAK